MQKIFKLKSSVDDLVHFLEYLCLSMVLYLVFAKCFAKCLNLFKYFALHIMTNSSKWYISIIIKFPCVAQVYKMLFQLQNKSCSI